MNTSITKALEREFKKYKTQQTPAEFKWLLEKFVDINPQRILEIGPKFGGCTKFFYDFMSNKSRLYTLDIQERQWTWKKEYKPGKILVKINGDSTHIETIRRLALMLDGDKLDFIFIDGDHTYEAVKLDFRNYLNMTRKGSIIAFHDIYLRLRDPENIDKDGFHGSVTRLWEELKREYKTEEYWNSITDPNSTGIGIVYV